LNAAPSGRTYDCLEDTTLTLTAWESDMNAWICSIPPSWDGESEPPCPPAHSEVTDCGSTGGEWGFWRMSGGTYELHTNMLLLTYTHGTESHFGQWLTGLPESTDIEVQESDYRVLRFRFEGDTAIIHGLTWEP
jgi:hypothetical protein